MSTLSVPLSPELEKSVDELVAAGYGSNKADVIRRAIIKVSEEKAVEEVLQAMSEPTLRGDLRKLSKKIK